MKKYRNIEKIYGVIWVVIFAVIGVYFDSLDLKIISFIFFGLSGLSILTILRSF